MIGQRVTVKRLYHSDPKRGPTPGMIGVVVYDTGHYMLVEFPDWDGGYPFGLNPTGNNRWYLSLHEIMTEAETVKHILESYETNPETGL